MNLYLLCCGVILGNVQGSVYRSAPSVSLGRDSSMMSSSLYCNFFSGGAARRSH